MCRRQKRVKFSNKNKKNLVFIATTATLTLLIEFYAASFLATAFFCIRTKGLNLAQTTGTKTIALIHRSLYYIFLPVFRIKASTYFPDIKVDKLIPVT